MRHRGGNTYARKVAQYNTLSISINYPIKGRVLLFIRTPIEVTRLSQFVAPRVIFLTLKVEYFCGSFRVNSFSVATASPAALELLRVNAHGIRSLRAFLQYRRKFAVRVRIDRM